MMQGNDGFSREEIELAQKEGVRLRALRAAFPHTIPIMAAFLFVGVTYGMGSREELAGADCLCDTPDEVRRACEEAIAAG